MWSIRLCGHNVCMHGRSTPIRYSIRRKKLQKYFQLLRQHPEFLLSNYAFVFGKCSRGRKGPPPDEGLEPSTVGLKVQRSTDWANRAYGLQYFALKKQPRVLANLNKLASLYYVAVIWECHRFENIASFGPVGYVILLLHVFRSIECCIRNIFPVIHSLFYQIWHLFLAYLDVGLWF